MYKFISLMQECVNRYENNRLEIEGMTKFYHAWILATIIKEHIKQEKPDEEEYEKREQSFKKWFVAKRQGTDDKKIHMQILNQMGKDIHLIYDVLNLIRESDSSMMRDELYDVRKYLGTIATEIRQR